MIATAEPNVFGIIMLVACVLTFVVVIFLPQFLRGITWGSRHFGGSSGVPMSRLGGAAWGFGFGIIGFSEVLKDHGVISSSGQEVMLVGAIVVIAAAGFYDKYRYSDDDDE